MKKYRSYCGYYENNYFRSYIEFIYYLYLTVVENKNVKMEQKSYIGNNGKIIIPDFFIYDDSNNLISIIELKSSIDDIENLIIKYTNYCFNIPKNINFKFVYIGRSQQNLYIKKICSIIKKEEFDKISNSFKNNRAFKGLSFKTDGFKNKKHSTESKLKISKKVSGDRNGMYNKVHSEKTKSLISKNTGWKNKNKSIFMKRKGMITHIKNLSFDDFIEFEKYFYKIKENMPVKKPVFLNNAYVLSKQKIEDLFQNFQNFETILKEIKNDIFK